MKKLMLHFRAVLLLIITFFSYGITGHATSYDSVANVLNPINRMKIALPNPQLSSEEWQWLREKQIIKLGTFAPFYPPFEMTLGLHDYDGLNADYLGLIAYNLNNITIQVYSYANYDEMLEALRDDDIDLIANARDFEYDLSDVVLSDAYITSRPVIVERAEGINKVEGKPIRVAIERAYSNNQSLRKIFPDAEYTIYDTPRRALEMLSFNQLDVFIGDFTASQYLINQGNLNNLSLRIISESKKGQRGFSFAASKDNLILINIINRILKQIPTGIHDDIQRRWSGGVAMSLNKQNDFLTSLERKWITDNPIVQIVVNRDMAPLSFIDSEGKFQGLTADLIETIGLQTGLKFKITSSDSLNHAIEQVKQNRADVLTAVTLSSAWANGLLSTRAYLFNSWVTVGKADVEYKDPEKYQKIAIVKGYALEKVVKHFYPSSTIIALETYRDSLSLVNRGEVDAALVPMANADFLITNYYRDQLKIVNSANIEPARLVFGVSSDKYPLTNILDKALLNITPETIHALTNKWYVNTNLTDNVSISEEDTLTEMERILSVILTVLSLLLLLMFLIYFRNGKKLKYITQKNNLMLDAIPLPLYLTDFNQQIVEVNDAFLKALEITRDDVINTTLLDHHLNLDAGGEISLDHSKQQVLFVTRTLNIHGEKRVLQQWQMMLLSSAEQKILGYIGGWLDITERENLITALKEAKDAADKANRTKTSFLATISHEIRTPMNAIIGMLELALKGKDSQIEPDWNMLQIAHDSAHSLLALIGDILDIAKIESARMVLHVERADIRHLIESVVMIFEGQAREKGLNFQLEMDSNVSGDVLIDPLRFKQVLSNLISNAIKFTEVGSVTLRADANEHNERLILNITVIDTGQGIDESTRSRLFHPFSQGESNMRSSGTGLGLYICKTLITMMGGTISLSSQLGVGTEVAIDLSVPKLDKIKLTPAITVQSTAEEPMVLTLLIVEDHPVGRLLLSQQLQFLGHHVIQAENGEQALKMLKQQPVDIIITDCNMPQMSGNELTQRIRKQEKMQNSTPVIIWGLTADAQKETKEYCLKIGMNDCLFKPLSLANLSEKLQQQSAILNNVPSETLLTPVTVDDKKNSESVGYTLLKVEYLPQELRYSPQILLGFLQIMQQSVKEDGQQLSQLLAQQPFAESEIKTLAHKILGGMQVINNEDMIQLCKKIEHNPTQTDSELLLEYCQQLSQEIEHYLAGLNQ